MSGALAFSHDANDAQKSIGVIAALLLTPADAVWLSALREALGDVALVLGIAYSVGRRRIAARPAREHARAVYRDRHLAAQHPEHVRGRWWLPTSLDQLLALMGPGGMAGQREQVLGLPSMDAPLVVAVLLAIGFAVVSAAAHTTFAHVEADGLDGLKDRSCRPHHSPRVTHAEVIEKIAWGVPALRLTVAPHNSRSA